MTMGDIVSGRADHSKDEDCSVGEDDFCAGCGVLHGDPCGWCGGRGYHRDDCTGPDMRPDLHSLPDPPGYRKT